MNYAENCINQFLYNPSRIVDSCKLFQPADKLFEPPSKNS